MPFDHFKRAQDDPDSGYANAVAELNAGQKTSHWVWYIFPQLAGLGYSSTARLYALKNLDDACAYLRDPLLGERLRSTIQIVSAQLAAGIPLRKLMGSTIDALKLVSSLTLFQIVAQRFVGSERDIAFVDLANLCTQTLDLTAGQGFPRCAFTIQQTSSTP